MNSKPIVPRQFANQDVDQAIAYYVDEGATDAALGFIDELERAYAHISRHPATGSARYAHELNLPGLRSWPLTRFPHLVFYVERSDHIDIWRVLHGQRDLNLAQSLCHAGLPTGTGGAPTLYDFWGQAQGDGFTRIG